MPWEWDMDSDDRPTRHLSPRKIGKVLGPSGRHIPNKAERQLLTQMMQKSGMTEEEVRAVKSNRQKLAAARNSMSEPTGNRGRYERKKLTGRIAAKLKLPAYDPKVIAAVDKEIRDRSRYGSNWWDRCPSY